MASKRIKKGDDVIVLAGKSRGVRGTVLRMVGDDRIVVEGANLIKKHERPNPQRGTKGGIVEREASLHISNVALFNPITNKGDRFGIKVLEDGRKVRYFKANDEVVDV